MELKKTSHTLLIVITGSEIFTVWRQNQKEALRVTSVCVDACDGAED